MKKITALIAGIAVLASLLVACSSNKTLAPAADSFVKVSGTQFQKNGKPYFIAGTNM